MASGYGVDDLTDSERQALHAYKSAFTEGQADSPCFDMNRDLRNGLRADELPDGVRSAAQQLDLIFDRSPRLKAPMTVFRGIGFRHHLPLHEQGKPLISLMDLCSEN